MYTRRDFGKLAIASAPAFTLAGSAFAKPNSKLKGVQVGAITYSFRADVKKAEIPALMARLGLSEVELM